MLGLRAAEALTRSLSKAAATVRIHNRAELAPRRAATLHPRLMAATAAAPEAALRYESNVIGDAGRRVQGNCVTCHGTLLYLREKGLDVEVVKYVDEKMEEPWIKEVCPGDIKMPMLHAVGDNTDMWLCGSQEIWGWVEAHHREARDMGRPPAELSGGIKLGLVAPGMYNDRVFTLLRTVLTSQDETEAAGALRDLEVLLRQIDGWLAKHEKHFIGGEAPNTTDCYLAPKLHYAVVALGVLRGWELPGDLQALRRYLVAWRERPSWRQSRYAEDMVVGFWQRKADKARAAQGQQQQAHP